MKNILIGGLKIVAVLVGLVTLMIIILNMTSNKYQIGAMIGLAFLASLLLYRLFFYDAKAARKKRIAAGKRVGIYIDAISWNIFVRPLFSVFTSLIVVGSLAALDYFLGTSLFDLMIFGLFTVLIAAGIYSSDGEVKNVPAAHVAMVTFLGIRFRFYREEGNYGWTGGKFFLGRYTLEEGLPEEKIPDGMNKSGLIFVGDMPIRIWNQSDKTNEVLIVMVARDLATVSSTLLLTIKILDPMLWTSSKDPLSDIGERARSAFRGVVSFFNTNDLTAMKDVLGKLMTGASLITSYLKVDSEKKSAGSVITNEADVRMFEIVPPNATEDEIAKASAKFKGNLTTNGNENFLKFIEGKDGSYTVETRSVELSIDEAIEGVGGSLVRASVGTMILPQKMSVEAENAASEVLQRAAQVASALAYAASKKIMDAAKTPGDETSVAIVAAKDNPNIRVIFVPGADPFTRAVVAAATTIGDSK